MLVVLRTVDEWHGQYAFQHQNDVGDEECVEHGEGYEPVTGDRR